MHPVLLPCLAQQHLLPREATGLRGCELPSNIFFCLHSQQDLSSAALLHLSFPGDSPKSLPSSTPELLPLNPLLLHLVDRFLLLLIIFCYGLFGFRWFGVFGKFNPVLNQSRIDLLVSLWACADKGDGGAGSW